MQHPRISVFLLTFLSLVLLCAGGFLPRHLQAATSAHLSVSLTANSAHTLSVAPGARVELSWFAVGAKECTGDWVRYKLRPSGKETVMVKTARTFTVTCVNRDGVSGEDTVKVTIKVPSVGKSTAKTAPTATTTSSGAAPATAKPLQSNNKGPFIQMVSPKGNEVWHQGEARTLIWLGRDIPVSGKGFLLEIIDEKGEVFASSTVPLTQSRYVWPIPEAFPPSIHYRARVRLVDSEAVGISEHPFTVVQAIKTVTDFGKKLPCGALGDVDGDESLSTVDIERTNAFTSQPGLPTKDEFKRADVDVNGVISVADIAEMSRYLGGSLATFSGCTVAAVSADLRANGKDDTASVQVNSVFTLSWTSSGGHCVMDGAVLSASGSQKKATAGPTRTTYTIECFGLGNGQSSTDSVTVSVEPPNTSPVLVSVDQPTAFSATKSFRWGVVVFDPDDKVLTVTVNWGDGKTDTVVASTTIPGKGLEAPFTHVFAEPGTYFLTMTIEDSKGATYTQPTTIVVTEPPRASWNTGPYQFGALFEGFSLWNPSSFLGR